MGVLVSRSEFEKGPQIELGSSLSAKMVRTWRQKVRNDKPAWLRRSRLVAREFNFMETRWDVFAPASSSTVQRLLPALAVNGKYSNQHVLGPLDVSDAFLMVPQAQPREVALGGDDGSS